MTTSGAQGKPKESYSGTYKSLLEIVVHARGQCLPTTPLEIIEQIQVFSHGFHEL